MPQGKFLPPTQTFQPPRYRSLPCTSSQPSRTAIPFSTTSAASLPMNDRRNNSPLWEQPTTQQTSWRDSFKKRIQHRGFMTSPASKWLRVDNFARWSLKIIFWRDYHHSTAVSTSLLRLNRSRTTCYLTHASHRHPDIGSLLWRP